MKTRSSLLAAARRLLCSSVLLLVAAPLSAQRMRVTEKNSRPVVVESATVRAEVTGRIAVTTFELVFRNPNPRQLEGTFEFPLLEGQQVVGFGLDINGRMRAAVPVEKDKGRIVFEEIERRRVDPGLLEQTAGNNYRARIFPIPGQGTRTVSITYQENLHAGATGARYRLPLDFPDQLKVFDLAIEIPTGATTTASVKTTLPLEMPAWQESRRLAIRRENFAARGTIELQLPPAPSAQVITEARDGREYFFAEVPAPALPTVARPEPKVIGLVWDASASGAERDHAREFALLDAWFAAVPNVQVRLIALRDHAAAAVKYSVARGDWSALRRDLTRMVYDGASSFDGLADDSEVGEWLLFSDGLLNYGTNRTTAAFPGRAPVHTILSAVRGNPAFLRALARGRDGEYVNLLALAPSAAAGTLRQESARVLTVETVGGETAEVFPEAGTVLGEEGLVVTGQLRSPEATLRLRVGQSVASREVEVVLHSRENAGRVAGRAWATHKIAALEPDFAKNEADIRRTSEAFGIVTPGTSLIVLETLDDYDRYQITPPEELRSEWEDRRHFSPLQGAKTQEGRMDWLALLWSDRIWWWEADFSRVSLSEWQDHERALGRPGSSRAAEIGDVTGASAPEHEDENGVLVLSPFSVNAAPETGYMAMSSIAGARLHPGLPDVASNIGVVTTQIMNDLASGNRAIDEEPEPLTYVSGSTVQGSRHRLVYGPASTEVQRWQSSDGVIARLRRAAAAKREAIYLEERREHSREPGFYLETAGFFFAEKNPELALRILSNLAELQLDHPSLLRVLAHRLMEAERPDLALPVFERVLKLRPEEPQSRRDLALACAAVKQPQRAVDLLWSIVAETNNERFPDIEMIVLMELNAIVANCGQPLDLSRIDRRFLRNLPSDLRIVLTWDRDACDIDLWVDDPTGERAIYNHPRTSQGGRMSRDFTQGYGPEEFLLRRPKPGKYTIHLNYFGDGRQTDLGPVTAQVKVITGFGTPEEKEQRFTVRLVGEKDDVVVATLEVPASAPSLTNP